MKLALHKKGIEKATLVFLILGLSIAVFYLFFNRSIAEAGDRSAAVTACKASVAKNSVLRIGALEFPTSLNCPARSIKISKAGDEESNASANKRIAESLYDCWYQYGEGKLNLYQGEGTFCSVCTFIDIEAEKPVGGLPDYLMSEDVPDNSGRLYIDYLLGYSTPKAGKMLGSDVVKGSPLFDAAAKSELEGKSKLEGKTTYANIFVYAKGKDELEKLKRHLTAETIAGKVGLVIGVAGGGVAAGGTMVAVATLGAALGGPPGWVVLGVGAAAFGIVYTMSEAVSFIYSPDNVPEWAAFTVIRKWNAEDTADDVLKGELGCDYFPAALE